MNEFNKVFGDEFFIIDSNNLNSVYSKFYGYAVQYDGIVFEDTISKYGELSGDGAFIWVNVDENTIIISQDFLGSYGLYLYESQDYFAISNSFIKLVEYLKDYKYISFNKNYADSFLFTDLCSFAYEDTLVNEINVLPRNYKIIIDKFNNSLSFKEIDYKEGTVSIDSEKGMEILDRWYNKWINIFRLIKQETNNIIIELSGGFDSRMVATIWLSANINLDEVFVRSYNDIVPPYNEDYVIASEIANEFNFKLNNNNINTNKQFFKEVETPLLASFFLKLGFHKEMHFTYQKFCNPVYLIAGSGGETIRGYYNKMPDEYADSLINYVGKFDKNLCPTCKYVINSSMDKVKNRFNISENDLMELPELMYKEVRCRNHFGKIFIESYLFGEIMLTPLIDSELHQLKFKTDECTDRDLLMALIFQRYCSKLLNFKFEGGRKINLTTLKYAKKLNEKYPFNNNVLNMISGPEIENNTDETSEHELYVKHNEVNDLLKNVFHSRNFEMEFKKYYSSEDYYKIDEYIINNRRFPLRHVYSAIAILKVINDTKYKMNNVGNLNIWINSFLNNSYSFNEFFDYKILKKLFKYLTARIDIKNHGTNNNFVEIIKNSDSDSNIQYPKWFSDGYGKGVVIQSKSKNINLKIKCHGDGELIINFMAKDVRDVNGERRPCYLNYSDIVINDNKLIEKNMLVWHDEPFIYKKEVNDGEVVIINASWEPF